MVHEQVARRISNDIEANPGWSLIFGRRKVGKTFLVDNFVAHDVFFTVRIDRSISARGIDLKRLSDLDDLFGRAVKYVKSQPKLEGMKLIPSYVGLELNV